MLRGQLAMWYQMILERNQESNVATDNLSSTINEDTVERGANKQNITGVRHPSGYPAHKRMN